MRSLVAAGCGLCLALLLAASPARAALTATELALDEAVLNQFGAVTFSGYTIQTGETEGRVAVGGNFSDNGGNICFNGCSGNTNSAALGATYGALNVWGNVSGNATTTTNGAGFYIQGNNAGTLSNAAMNIAGSNDGTITNPSVINIGAASAGNTSNLNGAQVHVSQPRTTTFPFPAAMPFQSALTDLATGLATDAAATNARTLGAYVQNAPTSITATAANGAYGGKKYGFLTVTATNLASYENFSGIDTNGLDAVFVIVTGQYGGTLPGLNPGGNNETDVIWDFVDATTVTFAGSWYGQILAPNATVADPSGDLTGAVIANDIVQSNEIHQYTGSYVLPIGALSGLPVDSPSIGESQPVVEPSALAVLLVGIFGLGFARRRRRRTAH